MAELGFKKLSVASRHQSDAKLEIFVRYSPADGSFWQTTTDERAR